MAIALIVAGGRGRRMGQARAKQYLHLGGRPVLVHTLAAVAACPLITHIYLVVPPGDQDYCRETIVRPLGLKLPVDLTPGGAVRQTSVYYGLQAIGHYRGIVVIHDGARPLVAPALVTTCIEEARRYGACIAGIPATDTLKEVGTDGSITATLARTRIWLAQTPQAFDFELISEAHRRAAQNGVAATDDAMLLEQRGHAVRVTHGDRTNIKITIPEDLILAEALLVLSDKQPD